MAAKHDYLLQFFTFAHLPPHLQEVSRPFGELARQIVDTLPSNPERHAAIEQLLRAKDCAVRALLFKMLEVGPHITPAEYRVALDAAQKAARERGDTV
jgi:hypothetical protein